VAFQLTEGGEKKASGGIPILSWRLSKYGIETLMLFKGHLSFKSNQKRRRRIMKRLIISAILAFAMMYAGPAVVMSGPPGPPNNTPPVGWDVNILNTPVPVLEQNPVTDVTVNNAPENPVPVTGTVEISHQSIIPVRHYDNQDVLPGNTFARFYQFYTVPAGKRLIVEHFSCALFLYPPDILECAIEDPASLGANYISPAYTPAGATDPVVVATGQAIKVIFGPGESFNAIARWGTPTPGQPGIFFSLTGYLEDAQ
jgi:hypothetical protein